MLTSYNADNSTSWLHGRYATNVPSFEKEPGLKHVTPVYLKAFCSLLSPNTICSEMSDQTLSIIVQAHILLSVSGHNSMKKREYIFSAWDGLQNHLTTRETLWNKITDVSHDSAIIHLLGLFKKYCWVCIKFSKRYAFFETIGFSVLGKKPVCSSKIKFETST